MKELSQLDLPLELKAKLLLLASNEGKLDFKKEIEEPKNNLFNLIKQYNLKMTLSEFVILTPRISVNFLFLSKNDNFLIFLKKTTILKKYKFLA